MYGYCHFLVLFLAIFAFNYVRQITFCQRKLLECSYAEASITPFPLFFLKRNDVMKHERTTATSYFSLKITLQKIVNLNYRNLFQPTPAERHLQDGQLTWNEDGAREGSRGTFLSFFLLHFSRWRQGGITWHIFEFFLMALGRDHVAHF